MRKIKKRKPKLPKHLVVDYACPFCQQPCRIKLVNDKNQPIFNEFTQCKICQRFHYMSVLKSGKIVYHLQELDHETEDIPKKPGSNHNNVPTGTKIASSGRGNAARAES